MKIISKIVKDKNDYIIYFEGEENIIVTENTIINFKLHKNQEIEDKLFNEISNYSNVDKYYTLAIKYISYKMRTQSEMTEYLANKECPEKLIFEVINKLINKKFLDDTNYSKIFIDYAIRVSKKGPKKIREELLSKGIEPKIINDEIKIYSEDIQIDNLEYLINKDLKTKYSSSIRKLKDKLLNKYVNRGYNYSIVTMKINELIKSELIGNLEKENIEKDFDKIKRRLNKKEKDISVVNKKIVESLLNKGYNYDLIRSYMEKKEGE